MSQIHIFNFNPFQVNTYVIAGTNGECLIIDPGCYSGQEKSGFREFFRSNNLIPKMNINTHCHIDHVAGNNFIYDIFSLKPVIHKEGLKFLNNLKNMGKFYGFDTGEPVLPENFIEEGDLIQTGDFEIKVVYTPGHADGSICLINHRDKYVISGDVLFRESIGRTDFETGDYDLLTGSIREKLLSLPEDYVVYPGHGPDTTIGYEKQYNPFL